MKKRTNKNIWMGMLALLLVFGMTVAGCGDDDPGQKSPEEKTTAERWYVWSADDATAKVTHSVASDGVCTITVSGTPQTMNDRWKASPRYEYTAKKDTALAYKFEAWTQSGDRELGVQYYDGVNGSGEGPYLGQTIGIDSTRTTYTVEGIPLPAAGVAALQFHCADQLGTFYVKIISITETKRTTLTITGIPTAYNSYWSTVSIFGDGGDNWAIGASGISGGKVTFALNDEYDGSSWNKAGKYFIVLGIWNEDVDFNAEYFYSGGKGDMVKYTFTASAQHTINFNQFDAFEWETVGPDPELPPPGGFDGGE
jgi:hypothetical protein